MPVVKRADTYRWTVEHPIAKRNGKLEYFAFDVEFKAMSQDKVNDILARGVAKEISNEQFIDETMAGWHEMKRPDASTWEFSVAGVLELCAMYPGMAMALSRAWSDSVSGGAARKN